MDVKDLRTEPALSDRNNDVSKYTQGGIATLQCNRNKSYHDIGSNPLAKAEGAPVRPCAVIGPDRVVPPPVANDAFLKKGTVEPWPSPDNGYRRLPDYPHRLHENPARNISPRQTFQENMQRINVPPTYNAVRHSDSANFNHIQDRSAAISKNAKPNMAPEVKFCDVPYALANEPKNVRDSEMYVSSVNSQMTRSVPHVWPQGSVNVNASRTYSGNEPYKYPPYTSCASQRPPVVPMARPHRTVQEDPAYVYPDHYYRDAIGRLKPYPPMKERCQQPRYEYVGNYAGQFHPPPPVQPLKYDIPKSGQTHPYPVFPHFKYLDNRVPDPTLESYQRSTNHQPHFNLPFRAQVIHPTYAQMSGNTPQKLQPYPPDGSVKAIPSNKLHYDNSKMYIDYENPRTKPYPMADNYYVNEMNRFHPLQKQMVMPNYSPLGMHAMPSQQYYLKDNAQIKPFEYMPAFRNIEPNLTGNPVMRHAPQFSPNTLAISPTDSITSNDTAQTHGASQEDCGYVSQSSTTSVRSIDSASYRLPHEYYKRHDFRYGPIVGSSHNTLAKTNSKDSKRKQIDVRQFLQMWNEGEDENNPANNNSKEIIIQTGTSDTSNFPTHANAEDQLYVLGLVNVPSEELGKYEHIEKISKLPENIKGYNNLELFSRFEEAMESCNTTAFKAISKEYHNSSAKLVGETLSRSVSPLDVESKISQSVIHKEVGCNFEIRPCSPKMLNVEVAAPAQNILGERVIEKVANPLSKVAKSPLPVKLDENSNCHTAIRQDNVFAITDNPSCKMIRSPFSSNNMDSVKTNYSMQDLEINSGVCLASLPRLDNEIELSFPEVNQQFINANKKDGVSTENNCSQSNIQEVSSLFDNKEDKTDSDKSKIMPTQCERSFNKLSKYRKSKKSATDSPVNKSKAVRTDSVIIKNPENIENKMLENSLTMAMNLSSQAAQWYDSPHEPTDNKDNDMALDFSLNKSGNDLPIIDTEKDAPIKPFQINQSHLSRENVLAADGNASCQDSAYINDAKLNSNTTAEFSKTDSHNVSSVENNQYASCANVSPTETASYDNQQTVYVNNDIGNSEKGVAECIPTDPKIASEVQNNQEIENKHDGNSYELTKLDVMENDTDILISDSKHSESFVIKETEPLSENYDTDQNLYTAKYKRNTSKIRKVCKDIISENAQTSVKKLTTDGNILMSNCNIDNDIDNLENKCQNNEYLTTLNTKTVNNQDIENMKQLLNQQDVSEVNKSEQLVTSQNQNDFEHDEISASLEKLFRESNEDSPHGKSDNCYSSVSVSRSCKKIGYQSKELYSPWIQKLLTHSEGSFNELHKKYIKPVFDPDEESAQSFLKDKLGQIGHNETIASTIHIERDKFITNSPKDLTPEMSHTLKPNALNPPPTVTDDFMKKNHLSKVKKENEITQTSIEKHDIVNVNKLCIRKESHKVKNHKKRNSEVRNTSKIKIKKRKLHTLKLPRKLSNRDREYSTDSSVNSKIDKNNCENDIVEKKSEVTIRLGNICDLENIIQKEVTVVSSKNVSDFVPDKEELKLEENGRTKENIVANNHSDTSVASGILNSSKPDFKADVVIQGDLNASCIENVTRFRDVSYNVVISEYHVSENLSTNLIENIFEDYSKNTSKMLMPSDSCADESAVIKKQNNLSSETLSKSVSGTLSEVQKPDAEDTKTAMNNDYDTIDDKVGTSDSNNIVHGDQNVSDELCNSIFDNCVYHEAEKAKTLEHLDRLTTHFAEDADKTSGSITPEVFQEVDINADKKSLPDSISINNCSSQHLANFSQSEERSDEKRNSGDNTKEELENSKFKKNYDVSQENENKWRYKSNVSNICIKPQIIENPSSQTLAKNICKIPESNKLQIPETLDSLKVVCTDKNIIQRDLNICDCDSDNFTVTRTGEDIVENSMEDDVVSVPLGNFNLICEKDDRCTEDITENVGQGIADVKSNYIRDESDTTTIQINNTAKEGQHNLDNFSKSTNNYIKQKTEKNKFQECLESNCKVEKEETLKVHNSIKKGEFDSVNKPLSDSNLESHFIDINDKNNYIKPKTKEHNCLENKIVPKNSNIHTALSSEECNSKNNNIQIHENKNDNMLINLSYCESDHWIEDYNEQMTFISNDNITTTEDEYLCCEGNENSLGGPVINNNLAELGNHMSNIHNLGTSIQESPIKQRLTLKRSFSDSALNTLKNKDTSERQLIDNTPMWAPKRQKLYEFDDSEQIAINENFCNFITNRRNSISSYYNTENVSFCILIDNDCILTEENEEEKICFTEVSEDCIAEVNTADVEDNVTEVICGPDENDFSNSVMLAYSDEKSIQESWLDDVACVETVVSDDIIEHADDDAPDFTRDVELSDYDESAIFNSDISEIANEVNLVSNETVHNDHDVSDPENTYSSPHNDGKIMLDDDEPQYTDNYNPLYSGQCLETILSNSFGRCSPPFTPDYTDSIVSPDVTMDSKLPENKENMYATLNNFGNGSDHDRAASGENNVTKDNDQNESSSSIQHDDYIHLPASRVDHVFSYKKENDNVNNTASSSSPEVSSTTFDEKSSSILLKITNYNGSRVSEINEVNHNRPRCKFTESKQYSNSQGSFPKKPLITKAAQKYIPPLKESIHDLKVKLPLPQQRLLKLKQLKLSKSEPKVAKQNILTIPKKQKPKPNFEDVLKNIEEVQIKMHKQNSKKVKNIVPKVVIKKNLNGSHYTSSSDKDKFNPDLTGRKWQPWVFLERNRFIDNMAMRNKAKAIFSHRKKAYVLREKFKKYKSVSNNNAKFVISKPTTGDSSKGHLKYTIKLKHS